MVTAGIHDFLAAFAPAKTVAGFACSQSQTLAADGLTNLVQVERPPQPIAYAFLGRICGNKNNVSN